MLFRFSEVEILENNEYDFENAKFLGAIEHKDYVEHQTLTLYAIRRHEYEKRMGQHRTC